MSVVSEVTPTNETKIISVPFPPGMGDEVKRNTEECMQKFCELVAHQFKLNIDDVKQCIPSDIKYVERQPTKRGKTQSLTSIDWENAKSKDELVGYNLNIIALKDILSSKGLRKSGSKTELIDRVWGIICPADAPADAAPKKRGRKRGSKNKKSTVVDDSDTETSEVVQTNTSVSANPEETMKLLENGIDKTCADGVQYTLVPSKKWLFKKDDDGDLEWAGVLGDEDECLEQDPPQELIDLYSA